VAVPSYLNQRFGNNIPLLRTGKHGEDALRRAQTAPKMTSAACYIVQPPGASMANPSSGPTHRMPEREHRRRSLTKGALRFGSRLPGIACCFYDVMNPEQVHRVRGDNGPSVAEFVLQHGISPTRFHRPYPNGIAVPHPGAGETVPGTIHVRCKHTRAASVPSWNQTQRQATSRPFLCMIQAAAHSRAKADHKSGTAECLSAYHATDENSSATRASRVPGVSCPTPRTSASTSSTRPEPGGIPAQVREQLPDKAPKRVLRTYRLLSLAKRGPG
jgi:hypothetical protein